MFVREIRDMSERKKVFVTGGSRGIGRGIVSTLAASGYDVAFTYNTQKEDAESLMEEVTAMGARCFFYQASLDKPDVPETVTKQAIEDLGGIDVLVCNAGVGKWNSLLTVTSEFIDFYYGLNYRSYILCSKIAASYMSEHGVKGNIVFITSTRGMRAYPEDCIYGSLKAALNRAVESMALEMAPKNIRVNAVAPGATAVRGDFTPEELRAGTLPPKIPLARLGTPKEVGYLVRYIISDEADYMTGNIIKLDGGLILPGIPEKR